MGGFVTDIIKELSKPMPYHYRVGPVNKVKKTAQCLAYIDARDAIHRLNNVLGTNWSCDYKKVGDVTFCGVGISIDGKEFWRWDAGTESNTEAEKGEASDSFKRACVKWGLGAFLYDLDIVKVDVQDSGDGKFYPVTKDGKRVWDLTEHINKMDKSTKIEDDKPIIEKKTYDTSYARKILYGFADPIFTDLIEQSDTSNFEVDFRKYAKTLMGKEQADRKIKMLKYGRVEPGQFDKLSTDCLVNLVAMSLSGNWDGLDGELVKP
jgi:hypothetical protein